MSAIPGGRAKGQQHGAALLAMLAVVALGTSWWLAARVNAESGMAAAVNKARNAQVLNRAKQALIGYVAAQAANSGEGNPGALPCPEAAGYFDNPGQEGQAASSCTLPKVGRFPWRTIGMEKLTDSSGEPLWYVVSPGWALTSGNTYINSNSAGQLTVDGAANDSVALIIAPGPAISVPAVAGCAAWKQARPTSGMPDLRNYLECENSTMPPDAVFATAGPGTSFNDQVVRVTAADILPGIEAAIAKRVERDIAPVLNRVYAPSAYGFAGSDPVYPYAAPFANPGPGSETSSYLGVAGIYQGLLPFNQTECTASASDPRCLPNLITWQGTPTAPVEMFGFGYIQGTPSCDWDHATTKNYRECTGEYHESDANGARPIRVEMTATLGNVTMGLRRIDTSKIAVEARDDTNSTGPWTSVTPTYALTMNTNGSVTITFGATLPNIDDKGWGTYASFRMRIYRTVFGDHTLLDANDAATGWFARNEWYRLTYYAVAAGHTAGTLPPSCSTGINCLSVANVAPTNAQRAILILGGRSVNGSSRPSATLANYLESGNATGAFTRQTISAASTIPSAQRFNDRVVVVGSN